jgi:hypothetical protein
MTPFQGYDRIRGSETQGSAALHPYSCSMSRSSQHGRLLGSLSQAWSSHAVREENCTAQVLLG